MQIRRTPLLVLAAAASLALAGAALAQSDAAKARVDTAKAACIVGEQGNGLLAFVTPSSDAALKAAVEEINEGRLVLYRETAARRGVAVEAAGAATYLQVVETKLKPGECYKPNGGAWQRK